MLLHMKAAVVNIRCRMSEVLGALERNGTVAVLYWGKVNKVKGAVQPALPAEHIKASEHPFTLKNTH